MDTENRAVRLVKLHNWMKMYWLIFFILLLVVMFLVKGAPFASQAIFIYSVIGLFRFFYKYEDKRREFGFKD